MIHRTMLLIAAGSLLATAGSAAAQADPSETLVAGRRSIALALPSGGGSEFAIWKMKSETVNRGFIIGVNLAARGVDGPDQETTQQAVELSLGPAQRRYVGRTGAVAPFVQSSARLTGAIERQSTSSTTRPDHTTTPWRVGAGIGLGVGAEWFPHRSASIAGHTGASVGGVYANSDEGRSQWNVSLGTFTSGITLHIYF